MIYTYSYFYDTAYHGPAIPVVDITISLPDDADRKVILRALVDSGADGSSALFAAIGGESGGSLPNARQ